jgi:hypothetical protein
MFRSPGTSIIRQINAQAFISGHHADVSPEEDRAKILALQPDGSDELEIDGVSFVLNDLVVMVGSKQVPESF